MVDSIERLEENVKAIAGELRRLAEGDRMARVADDDTRMRGGLRVDDPGAHG
jgi:hypothetical protein